VTGMPVTRNFKRTVSDRIRRDASFARALLDEAASLFLNGEPETARTTLRELVNATVGFERLAEVSGKPAKSLHRMLSATGNPSMDNLAVIFGAIRHELGVGIRVRTVKAA
jgi:DNA-binding phage protein